MSGSPQASSRRAAEASCRRARIQEERAAPRRDASRERGFGARRCAAAGAVGIAENWTLLLWLRSRKFGELAELYEQTAATTRADLGSQRFACRLGSLDVETAKPSHDVPPAQVRQHTI